ncbi:MAG: hypothetical protein F4160_15330 [Rhodospirillaceae bacterium]|nr:hypothetical protein [Rhodospirillaceae bacterium]
MVAGARRNLRNDPQGGSFENANTAGYFRSYSAHTSWPRVRARQADDSFGTRDVLGALTVDDQLHQQSAKTQFEPYFSRSFPRAARFSTSMPSIVHFGLTTSSSNYGIWLLESLQELAECPTYAYEEEMAEPSDLALAKTKELLEELAKYLFDRPEVYPMQQSSIAIDFRAADNKSGVLFLVEQDGAGALFHRTHNSKGRLRVDDASDLLKEGGIRELKRVGIR